MHADGVWQQQAGPEPDEIALIPAGRGWGGDKDLLVAVREAPRRSPPPAQPGPSRDLYKLLSLCQPRQDTAKRRCWKAREDMFVYSGWKRSRIEV